MTQSISPLTELEAINQVLVAIGQGPVDTLDNTNPDVAVVQTTMSQVSRDVQAEGWSFNKQQNYPLTPDENQNIKYQYTCTLLTLVTNARSINISSEQIFMNVDADVIFRFSMRVFSILVWRRHHVNRTVAVHKL